MSAVYKAYDPNLRRVVAVKIIHPHLSGDAQFVQRFEEEAAAVAQLRHPNIIQVYDFNHDGEVYFIIFEYVPGETVQDRLKRLKAANRQMDTGEATKIVQQIAGGLQNAHSKGLIHRDIKPANIMLNITGDPIIMDFGIAKIMGGTQHTATGAVMGTARYMSPEQIQGTVIDPRTDIYSLGVTFFEMLGGRPPFEANSAMTLMMMHMTDPVPDLNALRSEISPNLVAVVNKSLAKKPEDRYQSAAKMADALGRVSQRTGAGATMVESAAIKQPDPDKTIVEPLAAAAAVATVTPSTAAATPTPPPRPVSTPSTPPPAKSGGSRSMLYIAGGIIVLLLILVGVWFAFFRDRGGSDLAGGGEEIPAVVIKPEETPDTAATEQASAAGLEAEVETRVAQEQTRNAEEAVVPTATVKPTDAPTLEPVQSPDPGVSPQPAVESIANVDMVEGQVTMITPGGEEVPLTADTPIIEGSQFITGQDGLLELTLEDTSILQMLKNSQVRLDGVANYPVNDLQETAYTMVAGDILLRVPPGGSPQSIFSDTGTLLVTLTNLSPTADNGKHSSLGKRMLQTDDEAAMSIKMGEIRVTISCYSGQCITAGGNSLNEGWQKILAKDGAFISSLPITNQTPGYQQWQDSCAGCLPKAAPPATATPTLAPATWTPTAMALGTVTATATLAGPATATAASPYTPTAETLPTTVGMTPTAEVTPTAEQPSYAARITNIALENGRYIVSFNTIGYTAQVPGRHVHFFFDTVSTANAGVPGSGPWKLYGGPSPFTEYAESDKVGLPSSMCILVANEDHSIIPGTGNCFPLP